MASTSIQAALKVQKRALRKAITSQLNQISQTSLEEQSHLIASRVLALPAFQRCHSISCYLSMPSGEVRTGEIIDEILNSGKHLFVPKIQASEGTMDFFRIYSQSDLASLPSGTWGIKEPEDIWEGQPRSRVLKSMMGEDTEPEPLDIVLLPGVAFDRTLSRLGHGKGYYDKFLTSYTTLSCASGAARSKPLLVGLGFREQLLENEEGIPMAEHDWRLDVLITPDETIRRDAESL